MKDYNTATDWSRNKRSSTSIIYQNADGSTTEITLEKFLGDCKNNTIEMFYKIKETSDRLFQKDDISGTNRAKHELPLLIWSEQYATETLEKRLPYLFDDDGVRLEEIRHRNEMVALVPYILGCLSDIQRRRFLLHKVKRLTMRKIAELESVTQQSVCESINGAEKKIKKYFQKSEQKLKKHPVKKEDY